MLDDDPGNLPGTDPGTRGQGTAGDDSATVVAEPHVDLSPWAPLLGMLDSTEPDVTPHDRPFTPSEGVERAHAAELRAESILQYAERGAVRTGELDRTEVGHSDDNRDVVAGRDVVDVDGMLDEHTGRGLVVVADEVQTNVGGSLTMHAHLEDNIIMAGTMRDEFAGGTVVTAAMSDDMAAGAGLRCTAPLDLWVHGLVAMEERPGTCAADGLLFELAGTLYEREYGPSMHVAAVARHSGTVATTMKTGFRPLMKVALGVRNLIPGGGGGGGSADASPPAAPPAPAGEAGAATLTAVEGGGALGRGAAGGADDTDEIASVVRTVESASEGAEVEELQHPASTADNLDDLARVDAEGGGYRQVAEVYDQPLPASAAPEPDPGAGSGADSAAPASGYKKAPELDLTPPGAEGYDFQNAYGPLREQVEHYRADSNWRGNMFTRDYLMEIDKEAADLFKELGGNAATMAGDNRGYKTANIYAAMEQMAIQAEAAENLEQLAKIQDAMAQLEEFVQGQLIDVAARTDEFAGTAFGSQRLPIDPNIDTDKLRSWLQEQIRVAQDRFATATMAGDQAGWTHANWEVGFYDQVLKSLDAGMNPLAESSEQTIFIQAAKVIPEDQKYIAQTTADLIELGLDPNDFDIVPPRAADQGQLDAFLEFHDRFVDILSDPEFHRSTPALGAPNFIPGAGRPIEAGLDLLGSDPLRLLAGGDVAPPRPAADFADNAVYVDDVRDRSFARSSLAASEETLERQASGLAQGDGSVPGGASVPDSAPPEPSLGSRRAPPDSAQAPVIDEPSGRWALEPPAEPGASSAPAQGPSSSAYGDAVAPQATGVSWESGLRVSGDSEFGPAAGSAGDADAADIFKTASEPEDVRPTDVDGVQPAPSPNDDGASGAQTPRLDGTEGEDANPTGAVSEPDDSTTIPGRGAGGGQRSSDAAAPVTSGTVDAVSTGATPNATGTDSAPAGTSAADADAGATGTRSVLYDEPGSFEGRSLEGTPGSDNPKELAKSLDGAEVPVEDLPPVDPDPAGPASKSILKNSDGRPVSDTYRDVDDAGVEMHREWARYNRNRRNRGGNTADSVWAGGRGRTAAVREANARWSEFAATHRTSSTTFSDDPRQLLYRTEYEGTRYSKKKGKHIDRFRGADPPNTIDRAHAAHYVPRPSGWETTRETGFGRLAQGWNEFPFSPRERIVNSLQKGEALSPDQIISLELGLESHRAAGGELSSSQYRAMVDMISDLGDQYRHARWSMEGESGERLRQLIEMLDHAAGPV